MKKQIAFDVETTGKNVDEAFAESIADDFGLEVRYGDGTREAVSSGEVSVRGLLGYV